MNDFYSNIAIGIIAGLLATLLTIGFRQVWICIIVPWFEELVYKDAKIEGTWFGIYQIFIQGSRYDIISIIRKGHHIEARITCSTGRDTGRSYLLTGSFRNLILSATYETEDRRSLDRGSMTLMLTENGGKLVGFFAYYSDLKHEINHIPVIWYREKTEFDADYKKHQIEEAKETKKLEELKTKLEQISRPSEVTPPKNQPTPAETTAVSTPSKPSDPPKNKI
jgi:hypothetical protein